MNDKLQDQSFEYITDQECGGRCHEEYCPSGKTKYPEIKCMPGYRQYAEFKLELTGEGTVDNAFNSNDGTPPFSIQSVEAAGLYLAIYNQTITPLGDDKYRLTGTIRPHAIVYYYSAGAFASKFMIFPVSIEGTFYTKDSTADIKFFCMVESAALENAVYHADANEVTLDYDMDVMLLGTAKTAASYAVVVNHIEADPKHYKKELILPAGTVCSVDLTIFSYNTAIPFTPEGTAPYTVSNLTFLPVNPNILAITESGETITLNVSFPVTFMLTSSDGVVTTQESELYTSISLVDFPNIPFAQILADLRAELVGEAAAEGNIIQASIRVTGTVSTVKESCKKLYIARFVDCGDFKPCTCSYSRMVTTTRRLEYEK